MPSWLPELVNVSPWTQSTYDMLYEIFCRDIRDHNLRYIGNQVLILRDIEYGKEAIFWHLTTRIVKVKKIPRRKRKFYLEDQEIVAEERLPDLRRCQRLSWIKPLIEHPCDPEIFAWDYQEGDLTIKTYIWFKDEEFAVIMKKYPNGRRRLITSFYIDKPYKREDFRRKYENRIK